MNLACIMVLPASRLFSINSLTALQGRWMTSPAAILLTTFSGSCLIHGSWLASSTVLEMFEELIGWSTGSKAEVYFQISNAWIQ